MPTPRPPTAAVRVGDAGSSLVRNARVGIESTAKKVAARAGDAKRGAVSASGRAVRAARRLLDAARSSAADVARKARGARTPRPKAPARVASRRTRP